MKVSISKAVFKMHPDLKVGFIIAQGINNNFLDESTHLLTEVSELINLSFNKDNFKNHHLLSPWSVAKEHYGNKARHYHTSIEKLIKKVLKKGKVRTQLTLKNIVGYIALREIIPFAIDDLDKIEGNIIFKISSGREKKGVLKKLKAGDIYYQDKKGPLGAKLDSWNTKRTLLTPTSQNALIHFEALGPIDKKKLKIIIKDCTSLIRSTCAAKAQAFILDAETNEWSS